LQKNIKVKSLMLVFLLFLIVSCHNPASNGKAAKTRTDSLLDEVMEGHNMGMAKMSKLNEAKNAIQQVLDSISRLSTNLQKSSAQYKMQLDSVFNRLTVANYAMEKWMSEFNMDSSLNNTEQRIKYLESEKIKISNVKDAMISGLQKADSVLKKR
jgi:hypothetical protein